jgi:hypothetical protein
MCAKNAGASSASGRDVDSEEPSRVTRSFRTAIATRPSPSIGGRSLASACQAPAFRGDTRQGTVAETLTVFAYIAQVAKAILHSRLGLVYSPVN